MQSVEGTVWFLPSTYNKMQKERDESKKELLSKKKTELKDLENSQSIHMTKKRGSLVQRQHQGCGWTITGKRLPMMLTSHLSRSQE